MKYLRTFDSQQEHAAAIADGSLPSCSVSLIRDSNKIIYYPDPDRNSPFYIEPLEALTVKFSAALSYSLDGATWSSLAANTATPTLAAGSRVYFRGNGLAVNTTNGMGYFTISGACDIGGNIMSLVHGEDLEDMTMQAYQFYKIFRSAPIVDVNRLSLPADVLVERCYASMFSGCTNLINAPVLGATIMAKSCYNSMFYNCTKLINAPALPALQLADSCYEYMFQNCKGLINAPKELPAKVLYSWCYDAMFSGCTNLINAPKELPATTLVGRCYSTMFSGCSKLKRAPAILANELVNNSCLSMFYNCTSLNYIKLMALNAPSSSNANDWVYGVNSPGVFIKNAAATWADTFGTSAIPTGWTVETAEA